VKAVSELFCPIAGEVVEVNTALAGAPETINADPHGAAWMIRLKPADASEVASLMDAAAYQALVAAEDK
jgi:glycine cleavage system H protein